MKLLVGVLQVKRTMRILILKFRLAVKSIPELPLCFLHISDLLRKDQIDPSY